MTPRQARRLSAIPALALLFIAPHAWAISLADCGNIHVDAEAECTMEVEGGCDVMCTPLACSATLYVECSGSCDLQAEASCTAECDFDGCVTKCERGSFDCSASCQADCGATCGADCEAQCEADGNSAECQARCEGSCEATCQGECDAHCDVELPNCETKCDAACEGSCTARANMDCQTECQSDGYLACTGGCEAECERPDGAIFCDGQWVDHGGHLEACIMSIKEHVDGDFRASGSAECENGSCRAEGEATAEASASCAMQRGASPGPLGAVAALGAAGLGLAFGLRRRRARG